MMRHTKETYLADFQQLTPRRREILILFREGKSNTQISQILVITEGALRKEFSRIYRTFHLQEIPYGKKDVLRQLVYRFEPVRIAYEYQQSQQWLSSLKRKSLTNIC